MRYTIVDDVNRVDRAAWDALGGGSFYTGHAWARYQQTIAGLTALHVLVRDGNRLAAATAVYLVARETNTRYLPAEFFPDASAHGVGPVSVLVGNHRGYANRLMVADSMASGDKAAAIRTLTAAVGRIAAEHGADLAWWPYLRREHADRLARGADATEPILVAADCAIALPGRRFEDYLASVPASVRTRVRRDRQAFARAGYQVTTPRFAECWPVLCPLVASHERHHGHDIDTETVAGLLSNQAAVVSDAYVHLCSRAGRPVGCVVAYAGTAELSARFYGFDHTLPAVAREYFEIAYYRLIETAYLIGVPRLHLGIGTLRTKVRRGATVTPLWAVATGPGARRLVPDAIRARNAGRWARLVQEVEPYRAALPDPSSTVRVEATIP